MLHSPVWSAGMRSSVQLSGVTVALEADTDRRWTAVDALFGACPPSTGDGEFTVSFTASAPHIPAVEPDDDFGDLRRWYSQGLTAATFNGLVARVVDGNVEVGGSDHIVDLDRAFRLVAQSCLADVMVGRGRHPLHGGALRRGSNGLVVLGGTGAGKSTLCYAAVTVGWNLLTDDVVWVTGDDVLTITGLPKRLAVPGELLEQPPAGAVAIESDARSRIAMPLSLLDNAGSARLAGIVFVAHSEGAGRLEHMPSGPSLVNPLLTFSTAGDAPQSHRGFVRTAIRMSRLPAAVLYHDAEPLRRVTVAAELLEEAARLFGITASQ